MLKRILTILQSHFRLDHVAILLLDQETQALRVRSHLGWNEGAPERHFASGEGVVGAAAQSKNPVLVADVSKDPRYIKTVDSAKSELALPLVVRDEAIGVLDCQSDRLGAFDPETIELLRIFSVQASVAIENARLYSLEQRKAAQLETINLIARQTTAVLDINELLAKVSSLVLQAFPVDHVAIYLREAESLVFLEHRGRLTPAESQGSSFPLATGLCGRALMTERPVLENDVKSAKDYVPGFKETQSELCIPLLSFGETVGVLCLESSKVNAFHPGDIPALESVADICANAVQNARYVQRMRQMAYADGLTGIFNRRQFETRIAEEIERTSRYQHNMSVIMFDIDHFKRLNDEFGHLLGDDVLRQVSNVLGQNLRKADVPCRFGGDEFAVIVPEANGEEAFAVADKLRKVISQILFPGVPRAVTITAGVASYPANGKTRDELVKAADEALYAGKQAGRNTVVTSSSILK